MAVQIELALALRATIEWNYRTARTAEKSGKGSKEWNKAGVKGGKKGAVRGVTWETQGEGREALCCFDGNDNGKLLIFQLSASQSLPGKITIS